MPPPIHLTVRAAMEPDPLTVPPDAPVGDALRLMNRHRIGSVLVVDGGRLAGIFTERDVIRRVADAAPGWRDRPVAGWMTADPYTIGPDVGWDEAVGLLDRLRVRHLPVVEHGKLVGLISLRLLLAKRTDFLNRKIEERTAELRRANDQLLARDAESTHNLRAAGLLQTRLLLPHSPPDWDEFRWAIHYAPLDHLGGDYYDFAHPGPDHLGFLIADASGHSLPAALVAIMARFAFVEAARVLPWPGEVLSVMNRRLVELSDERFVTGVYAVCDRNPLALRYASAGHPPPLHFRAADRSVRPLAGTGFLLGVIPDEVYAERVVPMAAGDRVCFYTDGLVESRNEIGEMYGQDRLVDCLRRHADGPAAKVLDRVLADRRGFAGSAPLTDDLTVVVLEVAGGG